jgi:hypothetical protein
MLSLFSTVSGKERTELALMGIDDLHLFQLKGMCLVVYVGEHLPDTNM